MAEDKKILKIYGKCAIIITIVFFERDTDMEIKLTLDRIEEGIAILLDSEGKIFELKDKCDFTEGDVLLCRIDDNCEITVIKKMNDETEVKKNEMSNRLRSLFSRGDKQ